MHVTGKVMNLSSRDVDMKEAIADISSGIAGTFSGSYEDNGKEYQLKTDIKLEATQSMSEVDKSDHLFVLGDTKGPARGAANEIGGKNMFLDANDFPTTGGISGLIGWSSTRTAEHEFGHLAGLNHVKKTPLNLMISGGSGWNLSSNQLKSIVAGKDYLNRGQNYIKSPFGGNLPNTRLRYEGARINFSETGFSLRYDKMK